MNKLLVGALVALTLLATANVGHDAEAAKEIAARLDFEKRSGAAFRPHSPGLRRTGGNQPALLQNRDDLFFGSVVQEKVESVYPSNPPGRTFHRSLLSKS